MSIYTEKAEELFKKAFKGKKHLISPISGNDVKIIECLIEIIQLSGESSISRVMSDFKYLKDEEVLIKLNNVKDEAASIVIPDENDTSLEKYHFHFKDTNSNVIRLSYLIGYRMDYRYSEQKEDVFPCIILNEVEENITNKPMYSNYVLFYKNEDARNKDFLALSRLCN